MSHLNETYHRALTAEFAKRSKINPQYTLRAFANYLAVDSSTLSQILSKKRPLSLKMITKLQEKLQLQLSEEFKIKSAAFEQIESDSFALISEWYHFAILDLMTLRGFKSDVEWIATTLSIKKIEAQTAIERLQRLGLIRWNKKKLEKTTGNLSNYTEGVTSGAHKRYQRTVVAKALDAIDNVDQDVKDITSITIAGNAKKIAEAKELIKEFRRSICTLMEDGNGDHVFHLAIQLYPVTSKV